MSEKLTVTYSDMQTWQNCPRSWYFRVHRRLTPLKQARVGALPLGGRVHAALEAYQKGEVDSPVVAWDALIAHDLAVMTAAGMITDDLDKDDRLGRTMLEGFVEWEAESGFHDKYEVIGIEEGLSDRLTLPEFPDVEIRIRGKLDRLLRRRSDNAVWVNDYKTMGTFSERDRMGLQRSPQARLYMMLAMKSYPPSSGVWVAGVAYSMLRKVLRTPRATPPFYDVMEIPISLYDLDQYERRMAAIVGHLVYTTEALAQGADHREVAHFAPSWECQTCPFKAPCDLMQNTSMEAAEGYIADYYQEGDPWERYGDHAGDGL
jgi:RecB family exonuclease